MEQALRFKAMYTRLGFSVADAAKFLQVTPRTVHEWISGRVRIPFAAYKLLRVQLHYELPGDAWSGWCLSAGRLYTPEGYELHPRDFVWWSLLVRKAAMFSTLYTKAQATVTKGPGVVALARDARPPAVPVVPCLHGLGGAAVPSKRLPESALCPKVNSRRFVGVREQSREVPPLVITGRSLRSSTL